MSYTRVANMILDLIPQLGEAELRVILVIYRRTVGWNREEAMISLSQFQRWTGLTSQSHIIAAIRKLEAKGLIAVDRDSTHTAIYQLLPEAEKLEASASPLRGVVLLPEAEKLPLEKEKDLKKEDTGETWAAVLDTLRGQMTALNFQTYFTDTALLDITHAVARISVPHRFAADHLARFRPLIASALQDVTGEPVTCRFVTASALRPAR